MRTASALLTFLLLFGLAACGSKPQDGAGSGVLDGDIASAIDSSVNHLLDAQSSSISENTAPSIRISDLLDGNTCTTRLRRLSSRLARSCTLLVRSLR